MGICGYNNRDNYTPSYLHVALSDNNYKAFFYQQKVDKRDTEYRNYILTTKTATTTLGTSCAARNRKKPAAKRGVCVCMCVCVCVFVMGL